MTVFSRLGLCAALSLYATSHAAQVTPMEKVVRLLKDLSAKVEAEGQKEAAQYDKYACFCKEQADQKLYSIEKSDSKIAQLKAEIQEVSAEIAELNSDISKLTKKVSDLGKEMKTKTEKREKAHAEYLTKAKDMAEAIDACGAAIEALKDSKKAMKGAKLDLAQVKKATGALASAVALQPLLAAVPGVVSLMAELDGKGAPKFQYQSNEIIATLESLQAKFKSMKTDLDTEEFRVNSAFESEKLGLANEKKFAEKEMAEKEASVGEKTEQLESAKSNRDVEQGDRDSDDTFMKELTNDCEEKAVLFDQRSKMRADELTTLAEATEQLQKGAVPNYGANKKLANVQIKAVVKKASAPSLSFVQLRSVQEHEAEQDAPQKVRAIQKALDLIHAAAGKTSSPMLAAMEVKVKLTGDHFVKVRALIKDLISKLEADAKAEASTKSICDRDMKKAVSDRDSANSKIEASEAKISTLTANKNSLESDISRLQTDIADLKKAMLEASELRGEEKAENAKTVSMSAEGVNAVKMALNLLKEFYNKAAFPQVSKYTPPKSDRDGKTVGDLAPEVFDSKYAGSQSQSKGITGILEVILSDFERTQKKTEQDEKDSQAAFDKLEKDTDEDVSKKEKDIKTKDGQLADTKSDLVDAQQELIDAKSLLESSMGTLESLKAMCVNGEESWEERKQKREEEIEALKQAMEVLENWQA